MMRIVFLLFAEERGLLPSGELFEQGYGISGELDRLQHARERRGRRSARRHLAHVAPAAGDQPGPVPRCVLREPAHARLRRLTVRPGPVPVPDRDHRARHPRRHRVRPRDAPRPAVGADRRRQGARRRRISFRDIDVEQIGYIYEGLLGYTCCHGRRNSISACVGTHRRRAGDPPDHARTTRRSQQPTPRSSPPRSARGSRKTSPRAKPQSLAAIAKAVTRRRRRRACSVRSPRPSGTTPSCAIVSRRGSASCAAICASAPSSSSTAA